MTTAKNVTVIPATKNIHTGIPRNTVKRKRVAGYARVSTDNEEQLTSYSAQVEYYTNYIKSNPDWEFVEVYTDEGISATNTKKREGFNRMIADALGGKIDLIVTKSVSRFARNTVDSLTTVRNLKDKGVEVYFEKENIYTLDSKGELLITIMSSLAQEESRSISENVTWGQRKRFADGKVRLPYKQFLGYRKGADGFPEIVPEEAETIRLIYRLFMQGKNTNLIAKTLTEQGIPTPSGRAVWKQKTIESILRNEKYKGSALLQKTFTVDFLEKKKKVNEGEIPQYYVEHSHPAIIEPEEWESVQRELARRKADGRRTNNHSPFSGKIICGDCGEIYGAKVWHSTDKYRRKIWQCNAKFDNEHRCSTPHLYDKEIKEYFVTALSRLMADREALLDDIRTVYNKLTDCTAIDEEYEELIRESEVVAGLAAKCLEDKISDANKYEDYANRYDELQERCNKLLKKKERRLLQADKLNRFMLEIQELDELNLEFNESLWHTTVESVTVTADEFLIYKFRNGAEISVQLM